MPTIAPANVMPPSLPANNGQTTTTTSDSDFATILLGQTPHGQMAGKRAATRQQAASSPSSQETAAFPESQTQTGAASDLQQALIQTLAADQRLAGFSSGFGQNATDDAVASRDQALPQPTLNLAAGQSGQAANAQADTSFLAKLLPQLTESQSVAGQPASQSAQASSQGNVLMSELRQLVESHDAQATVQLSRGDQTSLRDMRTLAVPESAAAITKPALPPEAEAQATSAPLPAKNENNPAHHPLANAINIVIDRANDKLGGQGKNDGKSDGQDGPKPQQTAANSHSSQTTVSGPVAAGESASDDTPAFNQVMATTTTISGVAVSVRPGQPLIAGPVLMQQVIDHIRDLPRPLTNRITLQLHPAELGELKINLTMREGMIRASVVTQTVQAQEILEKHMPKLRDLLAGQGLTLDNVRIGQDRIPVTDPAFFDHGGSRGQEYHGAAAKRAVSPGGDDGAGFAQALEQAGFNGQAHDDNRLGLSRRGLNRHGLDQSNLNIHA